jgi:predicted Fe-Mo cluster-binding NifX family protein
MKIVVTAEGNDLGASTSRRFGRCPTYIIVETDTMACGLVPNPAVSSSGGAGIQAAQFLVEKGAKAVLTGKLGPNAADVLQAAGIRVYLNDQATVQAAVVAYKAGQLPVAVGADVPAHAGIGVRRGTGRGMGQGASRDAAPNTDAHARDEELSDLRELAADLRRQLAGVIDRIEKLEKES